MEDKFRIFIANRGEILVRIAHTIHAKGMECASIIQQNEINKFGPHLDRMSTHEKLSVKNYLDGDAIIETAKSLQCQAIHPGFGFLSENAAFAQKVIDAGLIWIGPTPEAIASMASKSTARDIAKQAQVPVIEGFSIDSQDLQVDGKGMLSEESLEGLSSKIKKLGYPVLIKAAAGGGGKGMRVLNEGDDIGATIERARSEAQSYFGSDKLIVESYLKNPRHIEAQILCDKWKNCHVIGQRDCSIQRRHQKIVEEAPALKLPEDIQDQIIEISQSLCHTVGYDSAGTIEFLFDPDAMKIYFLEMNTRLQVEHTVTEQIHHIDLVSAQIDIALGKNLQTAAYTPVPHQHSIELRIYAEDPANNFSPCPGKVYFFRPYSSHFIRWELGIGEQDEITAGFDPMIGKIIATGSDRRTALAQLIVALESTVFVGPVNNILYLAELCRLAMQQDELPSIRFIDNYHKLICDNLESKNKIAAEIFETLRPHLNSALSPTESKGFSSKDLIESAFGKAGSVFKASSDPSDTRPFQIIESKSFRSGNDHISLVLGKPCDTNSLSRFFTYALVETPAAKSEYFFYAGALASSRTPFGYKLKSQSSVAKGKGHLFSPVPGNIFKILVKPDEAVSTNQVLMIVESMKMEYEIKADMDGKISSIATQEGETCDTETCLMIIK